MITFIEHNHTGYALRTRVNAESAPATLAFATNWQSPGMILTRKCCYGKPFIKVDLNEYQRLWKADIQRIIDELNGITDLNIAGNSMPSLRGKYTQEGINAAVYDVLDKIHGVTPITHIRSGGQGGVDLAGLLWADDNNVPAICLAPKGWMFRLDDGRDCYGEAAFMRRFPKYDMSDLI